MERKAEIALPVRMFAYRMKLRRNPGFVNHSSSAAQKLANIGRQAFCEK